MVPGVVASVVPSYLIVTVEDMVNELPDTVTVLATAPLTGFRIIDCVGGVDTVKV